MQPPPSDKHTLETSLNFTPKFDRDGLIVAIAQDAVTNEILMVAYMNETSLRMTLELGEAVYYSRSRKEIWHKGKTSGHTQKVSAILADCDQDALIIKVHQTGEGACHTGFRSCFYRGINFPNAGELKLAQIIAEKAYDAEATYGTKK